MFTMGPLESRPNIRTPDHGAILIISSIFIYIYMYSQSNQFFYTYMPKVCQFFLLSISLKTNLILNIKIFKGSLMSKKFGLINAD